MAFLQDRLTRCCYSLCQRFVRRTGLFEFTALEEMFATTRESAPGPDWFLTVCTGRLAVSALNFPVLPRSGAHGGAAVPASFSALCSSPIVLYQRSRPVDPHAGGPASIDLAQSVTAKSSLLLCVLAFGSTPLSASIRLQSVWPKHHD